MAKTILDKRTVRKASRKTLACVTSLILAVGLVPASAFADGNYPDTDAPVYAGPQKSCTVDVGNVTVNAENLEFSYAVYAHAQNRDEVDYSATANVHGDVSITGKDNVTTSAVVADAQSQTATVNVDGNITADIENAGVDDNAVFAADASASQPGTEALLNVGGTIKAINTGSTNSLTYSNGLNQKARTGTSEQQAVSRVVVNGDVIAIAVDETGKPIGEAVGIDFSADNFSSNYTIILGGVMTEGLLSTGLNFNTSATSTTPVPDAGAKTIISVGQGGISSSSSSGVARCICSYNNGGSVLIFVGGDMTATSEQGRALGALFDGRAGSSELMVDGTITAKAVGVVNGLRAGTLDITVWKIDSSIVVGKFAEDVLHGQAVSPEEEGKGESFVDDEDAEKAVNYIIKLEQPKEGNILKLIGTSVKSIVAADGEHSYDVAHMGEKVYLGVADGWIITSAFNGMGEKLPLEKDENGWFVVVPNGGGVYLSAQVAKVEPAPAPVSASGESTNADTQGTCSSASPVPKTGDSAPLVPAVVILLLSIGAFSVVHSRRRAVRSKNSDTSNSRSKHSVE